MRWWRDPQVLTVLGLGALTALRLAWLSTAPFDLYQDEAQYWIWAQHLAWGYFSKPPLVAWLIWATTSVFGDGVLAVKLASPLLYFFTSLVIYALGARLFSPRIGAWSAIAFATLPAVWLSAGVISTDVPLLLFWALATWGLVRAREEARPIGWWLLVGLATGLGLLSKYAMGFWIGSTLLFLIAVKDERRHLKPFLAAMALALLVWSPNLLWNQGNRFITFRSTSDTAAVHGLHLNWGPFGDFVLAQFGVFGPIFFGALLVIVADRRRWLHDRRLLLLVALSAPTLAVMIGESALSRAHANWSAPTYVAAVVLVTAILLETGKRWLVALSVALNSAVMVLGYSALAASHVAGHPPSHKLDPLHEVMGYQSLGRQLSQLATRAPALPFLGDERATMAEMIYYMRPHPFSMRKWNPTGEIGDTFDLSQSLPDRPGGDYLWVTGQPTNGAILSRFQRYRVIGEASVQVDPDTTRKLWLVALFGFKGYGGGGPSGASS
jgi:4-amino-4-deoxy-L-arabinose transferase-like glycosyltransferase